MAHEVIVVSNGLAQNRLKPLRERDNITIVASRTNLGFSRGCNRGAATARGEYLLLLNDDTEVEPGWLDSLVRTARAVPSAGAVGAQILFPDGRLQEAGMILWNDGSTTHIGMGLPPNTKRYMGVRHVDFCSGCCLLIDRRAWHLLEGLDPVFFPAYYEDADLCMRLRQAGFTVLFDPKAQVKHSRSASSELGWRTFLAERNSRIFMSKWNVELGTHGVRPDNPSSDLDAVAKEVRRAARTGAALASAASRRGTHLEGTITATSPPPRLRSEASAEASGQPSTAAQSDMLLIELAAAQQELLLKDEFIEQLTRDRQALQRIRGAMRYLPIPQPMLRRIGGWMRSP